MRSIRLSLLFYFLALVAVALGISQVMVYQIAQASVRDKEKATRDLINTQFEERCREAHNRLDDRLLSQAKVLAGRVRPRFRPSREGFFHLHALGMLTSAVSPQAHTMVPHAFWLTQGTSGRRRPWAMSNPVQFQIWYHDMIELGLGDEVALPEEGQNPGITAIIETNGWSKPLPIHGDLPLPSATDYAPQERLTWTFDDYALENGTTVRRVRFRALLTLQDVITSGPPPSRGAQVPRPAIIIQCAANLQDLEAVMASFREQRDGEQQTLLAETREALGRQRSRLLLIAGLTFAATILGCFGLVWMGLLPLRKLSDAVSRLSPRNFTLNLEPKDLPVELQPVTQRLAESMDQLRRAFNREKQATADISHELRTPLAALLTTLELALRKSRGVEEYREMLHECHSSAKQMHQIVERLLVLARIDAGVDQIRPRIVDFYSLVDQCAQGVRPLAEARGLQLEVHHSPAQGSDQETAGIIHTDPDKVREIINNLLYNAIQYNRPDGRVDVTLDQKGGQVVLEVRDTGIGISQEARERIFERFYRADPSRAGDGMNAGLGLAIVKEYVELMGGGIRVESRPGEGTCFRVDIPVSVPATAA
ncbi:MAG: sensor histidine kinase [Gemmataceae bacterium]